MQKRVNNNLLAVATIPNNNLESNIVVSDRKRAMDFGVVDIENSYDQNKPDMSIECGPIEKKPRVEKQSY